MEKISIGVIGGSGVYHIESLADVKEIRIKTPFGNPSDAIVTGVLGNQRIAFLPRHGRGHRITPTELNVRANIYALKSLGVERLISVSACGSLRKDFPPLDIVIPDQIFDRTKSRAATFFGDGLVVHISFADPFCPELSEVLYRAAQKSGARAHKGGKLVVIEGPQFSTRAESEEYRRMKMDIIGMTALPEAKLAREAEICYATIALVTDYDVWYPGHDTVTAEMVVKNLLQNAEMGKKIVQNAAGNIPAAREHCPCPHALRDAIITAPDKIPAATRAKVELLVGKYLPQLASRAKKSRRK